MKIEISTTESSTIHISYPIGGRHKYFHCPSGIKNPANYLTVWLISKSRHLFMAMPLEAPSLAINKKLYDTFPISSELILIFSIIPINIFKILTLVPL